MQSIGSYLRSSCMQRPSYELGHKKANGAAGFWERMLKVPSEYWAGSQRYRLANAIPSAWYPPAVDEKIRSCQRNLMEADDGSL